MNERILIFRNCLFYFFSLKLFWLITGIALFCELSEIIYIACTQNDIRKKLFLCSFIRAYYLNELMVIIQNEYSCKRIYSYREMLDFN